MHFGRQPTNTENLDFCPLAGVYSIYIRSDPAYLRNRSAHVPIDQGYIQQQCPRRMMESRPNIPLEYVRLTPSARLESAS